MPLPEPPPHDLPEFHALTPKTVGRLRVLHIGDIELNIDGHQLRVRGQVVHLPHKEFLVLRLLMENAGRVLTRGEILDSAWGPHRRDDNKTVEVHIRRIRQRIETDPNAPTRIRTVRGVGYIYDLPVEPRINPEFNGLSQPSRLPTVH